jgi:hypothetical protein
MSDEPSANQDQIQKDALEKKGSNQDLPALSTLAEPDLGASAREQPQSIQELTAEEQMALYEKDLKENDWGHQPC